VAKGALAYLYMSKGMAKVNISAVAHRVAGKPISLPPNMWKRLKSYASRNIFSHVIEILEQKYGSELESLVESEFSGDDFKIYKDAQNHLKTRTPKNPFLVPLDLNGWSGFYNLKVPFTADWFTNLSQSDDWNLVLDIFPEMTKVEFDKWKSSAIKPLKVYFTQIKNPGVNGQYLPGKSRINISLSDVGQSVISGDYEEYKKKTNRILDLLEHEFTHYVNHLQNSIIALGFASDDKFRSNKGFDIYESMLGSGITTDREAQVCKDAAASRDPSKYLSIFTDIPPNDVVNLNHSPEYVLTDVEFKPLIISYVDELVHQYKSKQRNRPEKSGRLNPDKFLARVVWSLPYEWMIDHAKSLSFKKRLERRYDRLKKEVDEEFKRRIERIDRP